MPKGCRSGMAQILQAESRQPVGQLLLLQGVFPVGAAHRKGGKPMHCVSGWLRR
jgi:hypothetical protein